MTSTFDPYAASSEDRYEAMVRLRAASPVTPTPAGNYVATAAGVLEGLKHVEHFVGSFVDTSGLPEDEVMISAIPEPRHGRIRRVINTVVAAHRTAKVEPFIRDLAEQLVQQALLAHAALGSVDLIETLVDPLPSAVIANVLGVPIEDHERFRLWSDELLERQSAGTGESLSALHPEFAAYIQHQIDQRRAVDDPPDDVITRFINTDVDGEYLSDTAIRTQTMFLIVAGNETTRNLLGNCLYTLARDPELYPRVCAEPDLIPIVVEESLRHDSPVQVLARAVLDDTTIEGCPLHEGDRVVFGIASANRDESVYECPAEFRVDRPRPRDHLAFGAGPHVCPGASLARLEAVAMLETFCAQVEAFSPIDGYEFDANPVFWALGPRSLPVMLVPRGGARP